MINTDPSNFDKRWWSCIPSLSSMYSLIRKENFFHPIVSLTGGHWWCPPLKKRKVKKKQTLLWKHQTKPTLLCSFFSLADLTTCVGNREWVKTLLFKNKMSSHKIICIDYNYIFHEFTVHSWDAYLIVNIVLWWTFLI